MNYYNNTDKLPEASKIRQLIASGCTAYTYEQIIEAATVADEANRTWLEEANRAYDVATVEKNIFRMTEEEKSRYAKVRSIFAKYHEVTIFGARRHSREAYPIAAAARKTKTLWIGISKIRALIKELEK
jgi:hypothetical protein